MGCMIPNIEEKFEPEKINQCPTSRGGNLPSLGAIDEEISKEKSGEKITEEIIEPEKDIIKNNEIDDLIEKDSNPTDQNSEIELEELAKNLKRSIKNITSEQELIIDKFVEDLNNLIEKYGLKNVKEALKFRGNNAHKIVANEKNVLIALEWLAKSLQKINSTETYKKFKHDAAHNGYVKIGSIDEANAGIAAIEQKYMKDLKRSEYNAEEFIENNDQSKCWDVKTARSYSIDGVYIFDIEKFFNALKKAYTGKENVIIQITDLTDQDLNILYERMTKELTVNEWEKTIIIHANNPSKSKSTSELIKYLGNRNDHTNRSQ
jgi:hypothetical protein